VANPIEITPGISIDESELTEKSARASGPGGQHVNKTSNAIELRFDVRLSPSLSGDVKTRLEVLAGSRLTKDGVLILFSEGSRSQEMNRRDARERLFSMIREASIAPKRRRPTRPSLSARLERLDSKTRRASVKSFRGAPKSDD
jgi:ribosome-associated protein